MGAARRFVPSCLLAAPHHPPPVQLRTMTPAPVVIFSREHSSPSAYVVRTPRPRTRTDEEGREDEDEEVDDHETTTTPKAAVAAATVIEQTAPPAALAPFVHSISAGQTMSRFRSPSPGDLDLGTQLLQGRHVTVSAPIPLEIWARRPNLFTG